MDVQIKADVEANLGLRDLGYHSTYILGLEEARYLSGRNIKSGAFNPSHEYVGFLGLLGYLCLLDLIGSVYSPVQPRQPIPQGVNSFKKALYGFTNLSTDEIKALYGLRCGLTHDFSQTHIQYDKGKLKSAYQFKLVRSPSVPLLISAKIPWDADILKLNSGDHYTQINMLKVGDLVEHLHKDLIDLHSKKQLLCVLKNPNLELINNYSILIRSHP